MMWLISSADSCFSRVVLPALSRPNNSKRTSCSGDCFSLRRMDNRPCRWIRVQVRGDELQQQFPRRQNIGKPASIFSLYCHRVMALAVSGKGLNKMLIGALCNLPGQPGGEVWQKNKMEHVQGG